MMKIFTTLLFAFCVTNLSHAGTAEGKRALKNQNFAVALKELRPAAAKGDPEATYLLGGMYGAGFGVKKDAKKAVELYGEAANSGHVGAQKEYGAALALGEGIEKNTDEGLKWLMIAVQQGHQGARDFAKNFTK
ncbi:MAG: hypothetical protein CMM52_16200 [Rhodospirillaceae bacterium]|nr:hypothetical protein [Rhodospirillaceae bacterium]|tara:strand:+ start:2451 stop:2852 length:402 start_codon:yes stop_codon:yes gene_type:complete